MSSKVYAYKPKRGADSTACRGFLTRRDHGAGSKTWPDMMSVEMTEEAQQTTLPHDINIGAALPRLASTLPDSRAGEAYMRGLLQRHYVFEQALRERPTTCGIEAGF